MPETKYRCSRIDQQQRDNCNNDLGCIEVGVAQGGRIHHGRQIALLIRSSTLICRLWI